MNTPLVCDLCTSIKNIDIHHISYKPEMTIPLCRECHIRIHKKSNATKPEYKKYILSEDQKQYRRPIITFCLKKEEKKTFDDLCTKETRGPSDQFRHMMKSYVENKNKIK